jgi:hypothetical protein
MICLATSIHRLRNGIHRIQYDGKSIISLLVFRFFNSGFLDQYFALIHYMISE